MGMTLTVYRSDLYYDTTTPWLDKHIGGIFKKFYGYTDISEMSSCKYLASLTGDTPTSLNYYFIYKTCPHVSLPKQETITFLSLYISDCVLWMKTELKWNVSDIIDEGCELLEKINRIDTDSFELCWS